MRPAVAYFTEAGQRCDAAAAPEDTGAMPGSMVRNNREIEEVRA